MEGKALHQNCNASWRRSGVGASGLCHYLRAGGAALLAGQSAPPLDVVESVLDAYAPLSEALLRFPQPKLAPPAPCALLELKWNSTVLNCRAAARLFQS